MTEKIKTTAPVLSVGADREQPNTKNHKEIIANETNQSASRTKPGEIQERRASNRFHDGTV